MEIPPPLTSRYGFYLDFKSCPAGEISLHVYLQSTGKSFRPRPIILYALVKIWSNFFKKKLNATKGGVELKNHYTIPERYCVLLIRVYFISVVHPHPVQICISLF